MPLEVSASRFSVLPDDDLTDWVAPKSKKKPQPSAGQKESSLSGKKKQKKAVVTDDDRLRQDAFALKSNKKPKNKKKSANAAASANPEAATATATDTHNPTRTAVNGQQDQNQEQFLAWQKKDTKVVEDVFQQDIEKAMMLSMIQAEEDKTLQQERELASIAAKNAAKKTMSLNEFHQMDSAETDGLAGSTAVEDASLARFYSSTSFESAPTPRSAATAGIVRNRLSSNDATSTAATTTNSTDFFNEIDKGTQKIVNRERIIDSIRNMHLTMNAQREADEAEKQLNSVKDVEIAQLKMQNQELHTELAKVKSRYKLMRGILDQSEIREKAEIVAEVVKLRNVKDEMAAEVKKLSEELEQSKTKVMSLEKQLKHVQDKRLK